MFLTNIAAINEAILLLALLHFKIETYINNLVGWQLYITLFNVLIAMYVSTTRMFIMFSCLNPAPMSTKSSKRASAEHAVYG